MNFKEAQSYEDELDAAVIAAHTDLVPSKDEHRTFVLRLRETRRVLVSPLVGLPIVEARAMLSLALSIINESGRVPIGAAHPETYLSKGGDWLLRSDNQDSEE